MVSFRAFSGFHFYVLYVYLNLERAREHGSTGAQRNPAEHGGAPMPRNARFVLGPVLRRCSRFEIRGSHHHGIPPLRAPDKHGYLSSVLSRILSRPHLDKTVSQFQKHLKSSENTKNTSDVNHLDKTVSQYLNTCFESI